jgi:transposase InsO family protein
MSKTDECRAKVIHMTKPAENFFSYLKMAAQTDTLAHIEALHNNIRPHSATGWQSPAAFTSYNGNLQLDS